MTLALPAASSRHETGASEIVARVAMLFAVPVGIGFSKGMNMTFDWHSAPITRATPLDKNYRNTQNVRRFLVAQCGDGFRFDRPLMAWIKRGEAATMGDIADEWKRLRG